MEDPVDHTLGRSIQVGIHGEKLLDSTLMLALIRPRPIHWNTD